MRAGRALPVRRAADRRRRDTERSLRPEVRGARRRFPRDRSSLPRTPHRSHPIPRRGALATRRVAESETVLPPAGSCVSPAPAADPSRPATSGTPMRWWPHRDRALPAGSTARESPRSIAGCAHAKISARRWSGNCASSKSLVSHSSASNRNSAAAFSPLRCGARHRSACVARRSATTLLDSPGNPWPASRPTPMRTLRTARLLHRRRRAFARRAARRVCRSCAVRPHPRYARARAYLVARRHARFSSF